MRMLRWTALALTGIAAVVLVTPAAAQEIKPAKVKRDKYVLTAEEIAERPEITNAYDAVKLLRPNFLKTTRAKASRGAGDAVPGSSGGSAGPPDPYPMDPAATPRGSYGPSGLLTAVLYVDDIQQREVEQLRNVAVSEIVEIRYLSGTEADGRYGSGHEGGAILLKTKKLGKP